MYFRLAAHLGMTVAELLARISSRELAEWRAYEAVAGPLDGPRADVLAALIASTIANVNRGRRTPYTAAQFVPRWDQAASRADDEALLATGRQLAATLGGEWSEGEPDQN
ncbi:hypothetical protein AB0I55_29190 [Actinocatenispora sera]|uniref:phage tail assembly protein T n=1 Tax=Actinocatenispora sera TaxID=390989 RepID=UPI0033F81F12